MAQASKIARSVKAKATDSTIANLPEKGTSSSVRAAVSKELKTGPNFTGQYLFDRFIMDKAEIKADNTKLDIVRQMVDALDPMQFGKIVSDFVAVAKGYADNAAKAAKDALRDKYDDKKPPFAVAEARGRLKTAQNHQTVMRTAYGVLKFAADELKTFVGDTEVGYRFFQSANGPAILKDKGINWDGTKAKPQADRQAVAMQREESEAMQEVMADNPRKENENRADYFARIDPHVTKRMDERAQERHQKTLVTLAEKVRAMAGNEDMLAELLDLLLTGKPEVTGNPTAAPVAPKDLH
jgi:hypothetical protein